MLFFPFILLLFRSAFCYGIAILSGRGRLLILSFSGNHWREGKWRNVSSGAPSLKLEKKHLLDWCGAHKAVDILCRMKNCEPGGGARIIRRARRRRDPQFRDFAGEHIEGRGESNFISEKLVSGGCSLQGHSGFVAWTLEMCTTVLNTYLNDIKGFQK